MCMSSTPGRRSRRSSMNRSPPTRPPSSTRCGCCTRKPAGRCWRPGLGYELVKRPDGYPGLAKAYRLRFPDTPRVMDLTLTYRALAAGQVDLIAGDATAGLIKGLDLAPLEDNRHYFPPYDAAAVARAETLLRYPRVRAARAPLFERV